MSDSLGVKISDRLSNLCSVELDNVFRETFLALEYLVKFTSSYEWHHKVETKLGLEEIVHPDKEGVVT